jgi:hypothetical protein
VTRRDYELIAASVREVREDQKCEPIDPRGIDIAETLARHLGGQNPRFDRVRFLRACGFSDELIGGRS